MKEIMDASSMKRSLVRMAHEIVEKNKGVEGLVLVGIKTRGEFLAERLKKMIDRAGAGQNRDSGRRRLV